MTPSEQRQAWRKEIETARTLSHPLITEYKNNRESDLWRCSVQIEKLLEYVLYLEDELGGKNGLERNL